MITYQLNKKKIDLLKFCRHKNKDLSWATIKNSYKQHKIRSGYKIIKQEQEEYFRENQREPIFKVKNFINFNTPLIQ